MLKKGIAVLDIGGQYAHLIARSVRQWGVYSEILYPDSDESEWKNARGLILSGGPFSVYDKNAPPFNPRIFHAIIPVLGICYGLQLIAKETGGRVEKARSEYGPATLRITNHGRILKNLSSEENVWVSHGDSVLELPKGFDNLGSTQDCKYAAIESKDRDIYGVQFHPEVSHTPNGMKVFENFLFDICNCEKNWSVQDYATEQIQYIRQKVDGKAVIALSGGIDSTTAMVLAKEAIGDRLHAVFVDHGLIREGESEELQKVFDNLGTNYKMVDASKRFLGKLKGIVDPERKREIIGEEFIRVFEEEAKNIGAEYLIQGTIYPDFIESGGRRHSDKIKTHHNVRGIPKNVKFKEILNPLIQLYKEEVRELARELGLPKAITERQPFPGPGMAVRITGEVTEEKLKILRKADKIVRDELDTLDTKPSQYFAYLIDSVLTGVKGDHREVGYPIAIRAVVTPDYMTAKRFELPYYILDRLTTEIGKIDGVTRVFYDLSPKPFATVEPL